jgi:hypothetical protein
VNDFVRLLQVVVDNAPTPALAAFRGVVFEFEGHRGALDRFAATLAGEGFEVTPWVDDRERSGRRWHREALSGSIRVSLRA